MVRTFHIHILSLLAFNTNQTYRIQTFGHVVNPSQAEAPHSIFYTMYGPGTVGTALTDQRDIGRFVARIITDDRTLNRYVFVWGEERSLNDIFALAESVRGKALDPLPLRASAEEIEEKLREFGEAPEQMLMRMMYEYMRSCWVRGDNTVEKAKLPEYGGALDARELYPDIEVHSLEEVMVEYAADKGK